MRVIRKWVWIVRKWVWIVREWVGTVLAWGFSWALPTPARDSSLDPLLLVFGLVGGAGKCVAFSSGLFGASPFFGLLVWLGGS